MEKWGKGLIVVGIFAMMFVVVWTLGFNLTGHVVWEPATVADPCGNKDDVWNGVFMKSYAGVVSNIGDEVTPTTCEFFSYKNITANEILILHYDIRENFTPAGGPALYNSTNIRFYYFNLTNSASPFISAEGYNAFSVVLDNVMNDDTETVDWNMDSGDSAGIFVESIFEVSMGLWADNIDYYSSGEAEVTGEYENSFNVNIYTNESYVYGSYYLEYYNSTGLPVLTSNISDLLFEVNTSWNTAVDLDDYFSGINLTYLLDFGTPEGGNIGGENINATIDVDNVLQFKPNTSFNGTHLFRVYAISQIGSTPSNWFNVSIVEDINYEPTLTRNIPNQGVPRNGRVELHLDTYFEDPDGDDLTYSATNEEKLNITFDGSVMSIRLGTNFTEKIKIFTYASDGEHKTASNKFYVSDIDDSGVTYTPGNTSNNDTDTGSSSLGSTTSGSDTSGDTGNESSQSSEGGGRSMGWILWVVIGIVVIGAIGFGMWYFVLREHDEGIPRDSGSELIRPSQVPVTAAGPVVPPAPDRSAMKDPVANNPAVPVSQPKAQRPQASQPNPQQQQKPSSNPANN